MKISSIANQHCKCKTNARPDNICTYPFTYLFPPLPLPFASQRYGYGFKTRVSKESVGKRANGQKPCFLFGGPERTSHQAGSFLSGQGPRSLAELRSSLGPWDLGNQNCSLSVPVLERICIDKEVKTKRIYQKVIQEEANPKRIENNIFFLGAFWSSLDS